MAKAEEVTPVTKVRPLWSGAITFGLVTIQVNMLPAVRSNRVAMRTLAEDGTPLKRQYYCPAENKVVHPEHLVRAFEREKDEFVVVTEDEIRSLRPKATREIDLQQFVDKNEIPPRLFERPYFLAPTKESNKAYRLLAQVMEATGKVGVATFVMHEKEYLVAILAENGILRAETLRFENEIRTPESIGLPAHHKATAKQRKPFDDAIKALTVARLNHKLLADEHHERLVRLVEQKKAKGRDTIVAGSGATGFDDDEPSIGPFDLMAAIKASVQQKAGAIHREASDKPPVPKYDELSAKELIGKIDRMKPAQLERLEEYERTHKSRKMVTEAIRRQLRTRSAA